MLNGSLLFLFSLDLICFSRIQLLSILNLLLSYQENFVDQNLLPGYFSKKLDDFDWLSNGAFCSS